MPVISAPAARAPGGPAGSLLAAPLGIACLGALVAGGAGTGVGAMTVVVIATLLTLAVGATLIAAGRLPAPAPGPAGIAASICLSLFAALCAASTDWSLSPARSRDAALIAAAYAAAYLIGMTLVPLAPRPGVTSAAVLAALGSAASATALAARSIDATTGVQLTARLAGTVGNPNLLAVAAALGVLGGMALVVDGTLRERALGGALIAGNAFVIVISGSRAGLGLTLLAGLALALLGDRRPLVRLAPLAPLAPALVLGLWASTWQAFTLGLPGTMRSAGPGLLAVAALAVVLGAVPAVLLPATLARRAALRRDSRRGVPVSRVALALLLLAAIGGGLWQLGAIGGEARQDGIRVGSLSTNERSHWWGTALDAFTDRPLAGHGAGTFRILEDSTRSPSSTTDSAHDIVLDALAGTGILGGLLVLGAGIAIVGAAAAGVRLAEPEDDLGALCAALAGGIVLAHGLVDVTWDAVALGVPATVVLGGLASRSPRGVRRRLQRGGTPGLLRAGGTAAGLAGLLVAALAVPPWLAARDVDGSGEALARDPGRALELARTAGRRDDASIAPLIAEADARALGGDPAGAEAALARAVRLEPRTWVPWWRLGRLVLARDPAAALPILERAAALAGGNRAVDDDLAAARRATGAG